MKHFFVILSVCLVVVHCQVSGRPPRPPSNMGPLGTPVPMPQSSPKPQQVSPPRPKGCSPGCGPTEICAELGKSYCRSGVCSVCIKMSSIRFPASALAGMFTQQTQPKPVQPIVQVQPVQVMPPSNPLNTSKNVTMGQSSDAASRLISNKKQDAQISIVEYAAKQRNLLPNDNGNATEFPRGKSRPPPPPPLTAKTSSYQVLQGLSNLKSNAAGVDINTIQDKKMRATSVKDTTAIDLTNVDTKQVKYPIIVTVPETTKSLDTATMINGQNNAALLKPTVSPTVGQTLGESHLAHIDQTQMSKWYLQYQTFKAQQALLNGNKQAAPKQSPDSFDYATFTKFQQWLKLNQQKQARDQSMHTTNVPVVPTPVVEPTKQPNLQPIVPVATQTIPPSAATSQATAAPFNDFNSLQKQYSSWLLQQQNRPTAAFTQQQPVSISNIPQPGLPVAQVPVQTQNAPGLASMQQQFLQWQQQQQQQNQANTAAVQLNPVANVAQPATSVSQTPAQSPTFDYATFQQQYQQWQQNQASQNQAPTTTTAPTVDYTALHQQWQQQQQNQGQNTSNYQQTQQTSSQEIQINTQQNSQSPQQQNTISYVPQQPVNNFNNDPFYYDYQQPQQNTFSNYYNEQQQNNNMMDMMLLGGFGGGIFGF